MQNSEIVALFQKIINDSRSFTYDKLTNMPVIPLVLTMGI